MAVENLLLIKSIAKEASIASKTDKYSENNPALTTSSGLCTWTVTHNLDTTDVTVSIKEISTSEFVIADVVITSANAISIKIVSASDISADTYRVTVVG